MEGLCKIVTIDEIMGNDYSLTPGRYVGVASVEDDEFDYKARLQEISDQLNILNTEATKLSKAISKNIAELI